MAKFIHKHVQDILETDLTCAICQDVYINPLILNCSHSFCKFCVYRWLSKKAGCPQCRMIVTFQAENLVVRNIISKMIQKSSPQFQQLRTSSVTQRLKDEEEQEKEGKAIAIGKGAIASRALIALGPVSASRLAQRRVIRRNEEQANRDGSQIDDADNYLASFILFPPSSTDHNWYEGEYSPVSESSSLGLEQSAEHQDSDTGLFRALYPRRYREHTIAANLLTDDNDDDSSDNDDGDSDEEEEDDEVEAGEDAIDNIEEEESEDNDNEHDETVNIDSSDISTDSSDEDVSFELDTSEEEDSDALFETDSSTDYDASNDCRDSDDSEEEDHDSNLNSPLDVRGSVSPVISDISFSSSTDEYEISGDDDEEDEDYDNDDDASMGSGRYSDESTIEYATSDESVDSFEVDLLEYDLFVEACLTKN